MVLYITIFLFACVRLRLPPLNILVSSVQPIVVAGPTSTDHDDARHGGIDDETLESYPKFSYSEVLRDSSLRSLVSCSICLDDYKESDVLRKLLDCGHLYHLECIDSWLKSHRTCPLCRTSPTPAWSVADHLMVIHGLPLMTPIVVVVLIVRPPSLPSRFRRCYIGTHRRLSSSLGSVIVTVAVEIKEWLRFELVKTRLPKMM
ncbi:RING-H2 finger protein ATL70-like [Senna tora]|uniref:RING-H2 finger protein ATL70-like n=1 Tax=Senna tora TaxID=362788 RepID=A0A834TE36_9FABA|nr:RING-H2 finger protein ATL70-like [Senna tora]